LQERLITVLTRLVSDPDAVNSHITLPQTTKHQFKKKGSLSTGSPEPNQEATSEEQPFVVALKRTLPLFASVDGSGAIVSYRYILCLFIYHAFPEVSVAESFGPVTQRASRFAAQ
jgi:hypothetical protein